MRKLTGFTLLLTLCLQLCLCAAAAAPEANDPLFGRQWALRNDGTFLIEEKHGGFPVFDVSLLRSVGVLSAAGTAAPIQAVAGMDVNLTGAWAAFTGVAPVTVAVIDTGIDCTHPDLAPNIWVNAGEIPGNGIDDDKNGYVDDVNGWNFVDRSNVLYTDGDGWHGTHCAGTIAAVTDNGLGIAGIVPDGRAKIMVLKVLGSGRGTTDSLLAAIAYAEKNGAKVCNLSLGTELDDPALLQAIERSKMLFVCAAGNGNNYTGIGYNSDKRPTFPAAYALDNVISVANLTCGGTLAESSNYGLLTADIAAPGTDVLSTIPDGGYGYATGTSMAAPMVTAGAALLFSQNPNATAEQVRGALIASARPVAALRGRVRSGGMLDLGAALRTGPSEVPALQSGGSAPQLQVELVSRRGSYYLLLRATDPDGDLLRTAWHSGQWEADQFVDGGLDWTLSLNTQDMAILPVSYGGSYSFYASDRAGHETVQTITLRRSGWRLTVE